MHTGIPRKRSSFNPVLNKSFTSSTASRIPTASSIKKSASASSCSPKENILPIALKQGSTRSFTLQRSSSGVDDPNIEKKSKMGYDLDNVQSVGSKQKSDGEEELSITYPVLADLSSSKIVETDEISRTDFDHNVININFELELSLRLAARHNDGIHVTLKRTQARFLSRLGRVDDDEASISLDNIPESDVEGGLGQYIIDDDDEVEVVEDALDDNFDLFDFLENNDPVLKEDRLLDMSLVELMKVKINYDREFPNTAIGRPPHIFVARYKRDMKRKAAASEKKAASARKEKTRCVIENEYIIDVPAFSATILSPQRYDESEAPLRIPRLIVTSPSDDDVVRVPDKEPPEFDKMIIAHGTHKHFLLDASYHN